MTDQPSHVRLIVTHPGGAHKDDLLACGLLAALHGCPIERREPTGAELDDATVAIVDIGGSHDAARSNFDHHHFPREHAPTCSLSLVLEAVGLYRDALTFCDWLEPAEWFDSRGPTRTAAWLEVPRRAISRLGSPIDGTLLRRFAARERHGAGETVYDFLRLVGEDLLAFLRDVRADVDAMAKVCERWSVSAGGEIIEVVYLPRGESVPEEPSGSVLRYVRAAGLNEVIGAIVYPDRRGDGYGLRRHEDDARLDFSRVETQPDVHFAHKTGFLCKTSAVLPERLQQLVKAAVVTA